jgi:hypothetical protein
MLRLQVGKLYLNKNALTYFAFTLLNFYIIDQEKGPGFSSTDVGMTYNTDIITKEIELKVKNSAQRTFRFLPLFPISVVP